MKINHYRISVASLLLIAATLTGCGSNGGGDAETLRPTISPTDPVNPRTPAAGGDTRRDVLLYNGAGVDTSDWQNTEKLLKNRNYSYQLVNSAEMNALSYEELLRFKMFLIPGGYGGTIYRNITQAARLRIRRAVREGGMGYLGICAGAWVGIGPEAETTNTAAYGFAVAKGAQLELHRVPPTNVDVIPVTFANGSKRELVIWGGPETPNWPGGVVARYSDGKPAISQTQAGSGFVVVVGPHPEAPQDWRKEAGPDPDGLDYDLTYNLIDSALEKRPLEAY